MNLTDVHELFEFLFMFEKKMIMFWEQISKVSSNTSKLSIISVSIYKP